MQAFFGSFFIFFLARESDGDASKISGKKSVCLCEWKENAQSFLRFRILFEKNLIEQEG